MLAVKEPAASAAQIPSNGADSAHAEPSNDRQPAQQPTSIAEAPVAAPLPITVLPSVPSGVLAQLAASISASIMRPLMFFPSWSGVLTLAWQGWPEPLRRLKQDVNKNISALAKENPGSRWPKTSLGCLRDGRRLTPAQLTTLQGLCQELSGVFQHPQSRRSQAVLVDQLEVVLYECRCLERYLSKHTLHLKQEVDASDPSPEEKERVHRVMSEMDDPDYWFHASRDGNREAHYRGVALGVTLVHELACCTKRTQQMGNSGLAGKAGGLGGSGSEQALGGSSSSFTADGNGKGPAPDLKPYSSALPGIIKAFRGRVDKELPGMYTWFADDSLHITLRALMG